MSNINNHHISCMTREKVKRYRAQIKSYMSHSSQKCTYSTSEIREKEIYSSWSTSQAQCFSLHLHSSSYSVRQTRSSSYWSARRNALEACLRCTLSASNTSSSELEYVSSRDQHHSSSSSNNKAHIFIFFNVSNCVFFVKTWHFALSFFMQASSTEVSFS